MSKTTTDRSLSYSLNLCDMTLVLLGGTIGARASELYTLSEGQLELDAKPEPIMRIWRSTLGNKSRKEKAIPLTPGERLLFKEQLLARANGPPSSSRGRREPRTR